MNSGLHPIFSERKHVLSLDGFRAISVAMVVFTHFYFDRNYFVLKVFQGTFGVLIFFVISGFLITTLLLREKQNTGDIYLKKFYVRRVLRIFPVAYLYLITISILTLVGWLNVPWRSIGYTSLYLTNISLLEVDGWFTGHFWSLAVEEQFYLMIPALIVILPVKSYRYVLIGLLAFIPVLNYLVVHKFFSSAVIVTANDVLKDLSALLIGSLMSVLMYEGFITGSPVKRYKALGSVTIFLLAAVFHSGLLPYVPSSFNATISSTFIALLILINIEPGDNAIFRFLNLKAVQYIGVLSYSIYIWQELFTHYMPWSGAFPLSDSILFNLPALALVSYLSYTFYEKRFLKLKEKFQ